MSLETALAFLAATRGERNEAMYLLLLVNGLRESEAFGLHPSDLDLEHGRVTIARKLYERKGGVFEELPKSKKVETIALAPILLEPLRRHLTARAAQRVDEPYLFTTQRGRPLRRSMFYKQAWNPIFARHPEIPRFVPHQLRHTTATLLKALGVPAEVARDILRHASIATTVDVYQDDVPALQQKALARLSKLLAPPAPTKRRPKP